ncbi:TPA: gamma-glutamyltransferase family protein [Stenotrophomonas maltophilia]
MSRRLARSLLAAAVLATLPALSFGADRITGHTFATRSEVIAPHAMAATSQPLATQIALDVMKGGGSAVDAAIAANAALGLMEPTGNGIGGDLFAIVWDPKTQKLYGYNGSGRSPKSLTLAEFQRRGLKDIPATGPLPVSVPGAVDGWFALHDRFGRKPMADNLAPAIRYAREGHPVAEVIAYYWDRSVPKLSQYPGFKEQFTINGHAPRKGEMWKNPNLASTLQKYDFSKIPFGSPEHVHLFVEAKKLAFADRARFYADMAFQPAPVQKLISKEYAARRRALISMDKALKEVQPGTPKQLEEGDTIYMTVADADGMMVSLIQSNYRGMGSGMAPPGLGFILQDRGEMFVLQKNHPNGYAPGKRPFQTIIPGFITKGGKPYASFGVMGGAMQPQGHAQIVMNLVDFGMNLQEAGDAPRIQHEGSTEPTGQATAMTDGGEVNLETGFPYETVRALMRKGHRIVFADGPYGGYQAIMRDPDTGVYYGASESRKDGQAAGY